MTAMNGHSEMSSLLENSVSDLETSYQTEMDARIMIPSESIRFYFAQLECDHGITDQAIELVSEDASYRLRQVINCATQFMKHSYRTRLTTLDIFKAMQELDCDLVLGHNHSKPKTEKVIEEKYRFIPEANVYVEKETMVDLTSETIRILNERFPSDNVHKDNDMNAAVNKNNNQVYLFQIDWFQMFNSKIEPPMDTTKIDNYFDLVSDLLLGIRSSKYSNLSTDERKKIINLILKNLSTISSIKFILDRLITFLYKTVLSLSEMTLTLSDPDMIAFLLSKFEIYQVIMDSIKAILLNSHLDNLSIDASLFENMMQILLNVCFNFDSIICDLVSLPYSHLSYRHFNFYLRYFTLRSNAAKSLTLLMYKYCLPFTDLQNKGLSLIEDTIRLNLIKRSTMNLFERNLFDYSMLVIHRYLGFDVCLRYLYPILVETMPKLDEYFNNIDLSPCPSLQQASTNIVYGELCLVGELLLKGLGLFSCRKFDDIVLVEQSNEIYSYFYQLFGDSISMRLPLVIEYPFLKNVRKEWCNNIRSIRLESQLKSILNINNNNNNNNNNKSEKEIISKKISPVKCLSNNAESITPTKSDNETDSMGNVRLKKKKGTGLLESMLFTDTTNLPKNESLSMFSESLLEQSHREYEKELPIRTYLYEEDLAKETEPNQPSVNHLIIFDGRRLYQRIEDYENSTKRKQKRFVETKWFTFSIARQSKLRRFLPGFADLSPYKHYEPFSIDNIVKEMYQESSNSTATSNKATINTKNNKLTFSKYNEMRHRFYHHDRYSQSSNLNIFNTL